MSASPPNTCCHALSIALTDGFIEILNEFLKGFVECSFEQPMHIITVAKRINKIFLTCEGLVIDYRLTIQKELSSKIRNFLINNNYSGYFILIKLKNVPCVYFGTILKSEKKIKRGRFS
jgi:hypothetical protein